MSGKGLIFIALIAAAGYSLTRATPPVAPGSTAADSAKVASAGVGARFEYGLGALGSKVVGGTVRGMVNSNEQALEDMHASIKSATGPDGDRARKYTKKIILTDSAAVTALNLGQPLNALTMAMDGKSLLGAVRDNLRLK
jgi:hypothetical protein